MVLFNNNDVHNRRRLMLFECIECYTCFAILRWGSICCVISSLETPTTASQKGSHSLNYVRNQANDTKKNDKKNQKSNGSNVLFTTKYTLTYRTKQMIELFNGNMYLNTLLVDLTLT
jgi:hypothetical protein